MNSTDALKAIGISTTIIGVLIITGGCFIAYKNYIELTKTKLEIMKLKKELDVTQEQVQSDWNN